MKRNLLYLIPLFLIYTLAAASCQSDEIDQPAEFSSNIDSVSYSLGYFYGRSLATEGVDNFNYHNFIAGVRHSIETADQDPAMDESQMQAALQSFQMEMQERSMQRQQAEAAVNREEAEEFLAQNAEREGVMVTDSGLQYRVLEEGAGPSPSADSEVQVHYRGTLINGEEFDSSYKRDDPVQFNLGGVIPGWTEGVQLMEVGSTYEFFLPPDLGYGNQPPSGSIIPPGAVLIFEVELLDIIE
ncbi:MAG: FKBP-type peptidyl-prolyl cis-trans isomerase [Balneolaceae bacterium]